MIRKARITALLACAFGLAQPAALGDERNLAPGVTGRTFDAGPGQIVVVEVKPGAAAVRILSPESPAYRPSSGARLLCEQLTRSLVAQSQGAGREAGQDIGQRQADQILKECTARFLAQEQQYGLTDGLFLLDFARQYKPLALLSGGYLQSFSPPIGLGYLKVAGSELSGQHKSWLVPGLFCSKGKEWAILPLEGGETENYPDCLQTGPFLVRDGADRYGSLEEIGAGERELALAKQDQAFVCVTADGKAFLGYSEPMTARDIAEFALEELGCAQALRLSGHHTAGLWMDGKLFGNSELPLTNAISVFAGD